jgi:quinol monooxygenase YgiN
MIVALADVYVQIPDRERVRELMRATQASVRDEPGCISYVFAETLDDPGHFVTVQQWRDQRALDDHFRSQAFADYQRQVERSLVRASELHVHVAQESYLPFDTGSIGPPQTD